jgi:hypothetical protein
VVGDGRGIGINPVFDRLCLTVAQSAAVGNSRDQSSGNVKIKQLFFADVSSVFFPDKIDGDSLLETIN